MSVSRDRWRSFVACEGAFGRRSWGHGLLAWKPIRSGRFTAQGGQFLAAASLQLSV